MGTNTIGSIVDTGDSNYLNGSRFTTTALGGRVVTLSIYVPAPLDIAANRKYQIGVYTDNAGYPGTFLGASKVGNLVVGWNTVAAAIQLQPSTNYWLMSNNNGRSDGVNLLTYDVGAGGAGAWSSGSVTFGTWPTTFQSTVTSTGFSIYAMLLP